jgi:hypothetical protein
VAEDPSRSGQRRPAVGLLAALRNSKPTPEVRTHRYVTRESTRDHRMVICDLRHIGSVVIPGTKHVVGDGAGAY